MYTKEFLIEYQNKIRQLKKRVCECQTELNNSWIAFDFKDHFRLSNRFRSGVYTQVDGIVKYVEDDKLDDEISS